MQLVIDSNEIKLKVGDITEQETAAIVNAANGTLMGGGGVDGAIHKKARNNLLQECKEIRKKQLHGAYLPTGEAVITKGYDLPARFVIHTVGPVWNEDKANQESLLAACYKNSLALAVQHQLSSIAFPSISTGVYRFPIDIAARVALETVIDFAKNQTFGTIVFTLFSESDYEVYVKTLRTLEK